MVKKNKTKEELVRGIVLMRSKSKSLEKDLSNLKNNWSDYGLSAEAFQLMADFAPVFIWASKSNNIERCYFNKVWLDYRGRSFSEEQGRGWLEGMHKDDYKAFRAVCSGAYSEKKPYKIEYRIKRNDDVFRWVLETGVPHYSAENKFAGYIGSCVGISEQKELEEKLFKMAHYDILTGIPNRGLFMDRLNHAISNAKRYKTKIALLYIDLDRFKSVNDGYGHKVGDMLLVEAAGRINSCVRESDTVARMGGDEFTVILPNIHRKKDVLPVVDKIVKKISRPFVILNNECSIGASVGIGFYPDDAVDPDSLIKKADANMYRKKRT
ncbi:MAG: sensor domain-containing diguanylate cyclase [Nitrospirae bacterium]|nr:sensor domain-containing diguanylate cyclase [Nitrospirota bacterium]